MDRSIFCLSVSIVRKNERRRPPFFINDFTKNLGIVWTRFHNRSPIETQLADTKSPRVEGEMEVGRDQGIKSERQPLKVREGGSTDSSQPSPTRWNYLLLLFSSTLVPRRLLCREKFESCPRLDRFLPLSLSLFSLGEENRQHSSVHSTLKIELTRSRVNRAILCIPDNCPSSSRDDPRTRAANRKRDPFRSWKNGKISWIITKFRTFERKNNWGIGPFRFNFYTFVIIIELSAFVKISALKPGHCRIVRCGVFNL